MDTISLDQQYVAGTYSRFPVELVCGKGSLCTGGDGREYIDMGSGIGVTAFGFCDEAWLAAVTAQAAKLQHTSNLYYTRPCARLARLLCEKTGMDKVFFSNSGAEANECAIKVARKYSAQRKGADCYTILTLENSFHGRTLTTLSATGQEHFHKLFNPLTPGFLHVAAGDTRGLREVVENNLIAGICIECVQGEGGVIPLTRDFTDCVARLCREYDIPLMVDEVQTGNGRTGTLYAYEQFGLEPDIVSTAKGLGGGLPIGATLMSKKVSAVLGPGDHGSTYGGNPVCCAGAVTVVERLTGDFLAQVREKGAYIFRRLGSAPGVKSVTGLGLMVGVETVKPAGEVVAYCREHGVLCLTAKNKVRLLPALNIPMPVLEKALDVLEQACKEDT